MMNEQMAMGNKLRLEESEAELLDGEVRKGKREKAFTISTTLHVVENLSVCGSRAGVGHGRNAMDLEQRVAEWRPWGPSQ